MVAMQKECYDYYPFGMPMPNRNSINNNYRYAYQGQEKDPENGKEAFELRLWDSRIGRWLTTDPKHEFSSPYLGMGNNPISAIDPDGGSTDWHWEGDNLVADKGDNAYTLSEFLEISVDDSIELLSSMGVFSDSEGILNLMENQKFSIDNISSFAITNEFLFKDSRPIPIEPVEGKYFRIRTAYDFRNKKEELINKGLNKGIPFVTEKVLKMITGVGMLMSGGVGNKYEDAQLNVMRGLHPLHPKVQWKDSVIFIPATESKIETSIRIKMIENHLSK